MASTNSSYSTVSSSGQKVHTKIKDDLPAITYKRTVAQGQSIIGPFRVTAYKTEYDPNSLLSVDKVNTYQEYIGGCTKHERCLGHFCITPRGTILLPQELARTLGIMNNEYAKMAESVYSRDTYSQEVAYKEKLKRLMLGKLGKMRGDMPSGTVDSSAREVISLCWEMPPNHIAIPKRVAENMRVLRIKRDEETGLPIGQYIEDRLREDDYVIAIRPPSLWAGNVQPMKVVLWNHECFGLSPSNAGEFHADHDGDEMQIYFITTEEAIEQCKKWKPLNPDAFQLAVETYELPESIKEGSDDYRNKFMVSSTLSIKELVDGEKLTKFTKVARIKEPMANMLVESLRDPNKTFRMFKDESIRGIKDVMAQQLNQGTLGYMSRQARLAAACVQYKGNGIFNIRTSTETIKIINTSTLNLTVDERYPLGGNSCMRGITSICSVAQQAALDSHRVSQSISSSMDLINNLIEGGNKSLVGFLPNTKLPDVWKYCTDEVTYAIINNELTRYSAASVVATYNPTVLKYVDLVGGNIKTVCKNGISMVCNYYSIELSVLELQSLVELFCYKCNKSDKPITTKEGLVARDMKWMVVLFATHYGKLKDLQRLEKTKKYTTPDTILDASAFCNFDYM